MLVVFIEVCILSGAQKRRTQGCSLFSFNSLSTDMCVRHFSVVFVFLQRKALQGIVRK